MENQIYRLEMTDGHKLEIFIVDTNEINPHRDIKELGICLFKKPLQIDGGLDENEIDSLIKFLTECKEYIKEFNSLSKAEEAL